MICQSGKKVKPKSLVLSGVSQWFTNCQTNRQRACIFFPSLAFALVMGALPEKIYDGGEREEQRRSRCRRALQEEVVTRDIWLPGFDYCTALGARVRHKESVRAI